MLDTGWPLLCALSGLLAYVLGRRGAVARGGASRDDAFATLHEAAMAAPYLRAGLARDAARRAVRHLRALVGSSALAVTSLDQLLAWDGDTEPPGEEHTRDLLGHVHGVLAGGRPYLVAGDELFCEAEDCAVRGAVVVPLTVDGRVIGALAAYDAEVDAALVRAATEVGQWASGQLELAELDATRRRALSAETRALRAQISPHFVCNSLTTIASFTRSEPDHARELLLDFADFARHALRRAGDFTTLSDELTCVDRYLLLERARFGEKLRFAVDVVPEVLPVPVPFLCLQPIVENAITHGIRRRGGTGEVNVVVRDAGGEVHITVEDDGAGMDPCRVREMLHGGPPSGEGGGIGLANVDVRLRQIYGQDYGLTIDTAPGEGTTVRMRVPKMRPSHD
ncbi:signal transduction histidine kinase [Sphaerisporangium siamense]|uniref:histidine kinase n=1 Tax=Sphaerisporangium siamense TaxID=795645 RepID=A0A7W7DDK6_9ACTN|nr:histidine kinase [Sphaerisporangium siamense]MBB4704879.1 two-component system LytT family sensor kinase [Sphaerisporangium siamense]GII83681.1 signal transduction histidine kinase [Sphaerisporangium siamense]